MSLGCSALSISCGNGIVRRLLLRKLHPIFAGLETDRLHHNYFRRSHELDEEYQAYRFAGRGWSADGWGAAVHGTGEGNGAGWVEWGARRGSERSADSGGCDEGAG